VNVVSPRTKGARRCTNPGCEYGGKWVVKTMTRLKNGRWLCLGRECHTVSDASEVIHPDNDDYGIWVSQ
jgi:hypothetical protein